jgi:hypothetical protein
MTLNSFKHCSLKTIGLIATCVFWQMVSAQTKIDGSNLDAFQKPGGNWHIAGDARVSLTENNSITFTDGTGILVNQPNNTAHEDLFFNFQHGDLDIEFDYLMAKGSNSGIYLQGRYEVQLLDSWTVLNPKSSDNGGIYECWDSTKPDGQKGYQGYAPRQNVSLAPGLWQHMKISFQAPKFKGGQKISNAKILKVELNGVLIQENVEMACVTRGAVDGTEVAAGPLRIQGDHGPIAFRNIVVSVFDKPKPVVTDINYSVYKGKFTSEPDYKNTKALSQNTSPIITALINGLPANEFLVRYTGILHITVPGMYHFNMATFGGGGILKINNNIIIPYKEWSGSAEINLPAGNLPFELMYAKYVDWAKPSLIISATGPGIREFLISDGSIPSAEEVDPILVDAAEKNMLRSFMDLPVGGRVTHGVSVGSTEKMHYTYDMDNGMIVQVWRGNFLDATPMWHERGDGSSRPAGTVKYFGKPMLNIEKLATPNTPWAKDTTGSGFKPKGYVLDDKGRPSFKYFIYGAAVTDVIRVLENREGIHRETTIENGSDNMYMRIAEGSKIEMIADGLYIIDDKSYYVKIDTGEKSIIRDQEGRKELIVPVKTKLSYTILF